MIYRNKTIITIMNKNQSMETLINELLFNELYLIRDIVQLKESIKELVRLRPLKKSRELMKLNAMIKIKEIRIHELVAELNNAEEIRLRAEEIRNHELEVKEIKRRELELAEAEIRNHELEIQIRELVAEEIKRRELEVAILPADDNKQSKYFPELQCLFPNTDDLFDEIVNYTFTA